MRRGTTPTINITVDSDLTGYVIYLTFRQNDGQSITKTNDALNIDVDDDKTFIDCTLTQEETLMFNPPNCIEVQIRAVTPGGQTAVASTIASIPIERILQDGVLNGS